MSGETAGTPVDLGAVRGSLDGGDAGVREAPALLGFADAMHADDPVALDAARHTLLDAVGPQGFVDAVGVVGNFERMNRIADAIGIASDPPVQAVTAGLRTELGLGEFPSAANTPELGGFRRAMSRVLAPQARRMLRIASRQAQR